MLSPHCTLDPQNIHLTTGYLYHWPISPPFPYPSIPSNHQSTVSMSLVFLNFTCKWDHVVLFFLLFHLPSRFICLSQMAEFSSFLWFNNIHIHIYILYIHIYILYIQYIYIYIHAHTIYVHIYTHTHIYSIYVFHPWIVT